MATAEPVAKIGEEEFYTLDDAFDKLVAVGGTLSILQDGIVTNGKERKISNDVIIEGNNHIVTVQYADAGMNSLFRVLQPGKLKIGNTTFSATPHDGDNDAMFAVESNSSIEMISTTIKNIQINESSTASSAIHVSGTLIMNDCLITNCKTSAPCNTILVDGGSLWITSGEITNCGYFGNSMGYFDAGAISAFAPSIGGGWASSSIKIDGTVFSDNAGSYAGAIYLYDSLGTVEIRNAVFNNNKGQYAGALWISDSKAVLENVQFNGNKSVYYGALLTDACEDVSIRKGVFTENSSSRGAGIYAENSLLSLTDCTITENQASSYGGGIFKTGASSSLIVNGTNIICNNTARYSGADIFNYGGTAVLPSVDNMKQKYMGTIFSLDGWYNDAPGYRWENGHIRYYGDRKNISGTWALT